MKIKIAPKYSNDWDKAASLVRKKYKFSFGADVLPSPEYFVVYKSPEMSEDDTQIVACAGLTFNSTAPLFSEQYLDEPIEQLISRLEGKRVSRNAIVEVGALASIERNAGSELVSFLPILLWCMGKQYVLCTVTKHLKRILDSVDIQFKTIRFSDVQKLSEKAKNQWGNYYDREPKTGYIKLEPITSTFSRNTGRFSFSNFSNIEVELKKYELEERLCEVYS